MGLGDGDAVRREIDALRAVDPHHLLAYVLEHEVAQRAGDRDAAARIEREFATAYPTEIATSRPEYEAHRGSIDQLRKASTK